MTDLDKRIDLDTWRQRIKDIQTKRVTPEVFDRIVENASKQKRAAKSYKAAQFLERVNNISSASNAVTLRSMSYAPTSASDFQQTTNSYTARSNTIQSVLAGKSNKKLTTFDSGNGSGSEEEEAEQYAHLERLEAEITAENTASSSVFRLNSTQDNTVAFDVSSTEFSEEVDQLLEQFAVEPTDDEEMSTKYLLFENFLANVTAIRTRLLEFWESNKDQFLGASRVACDKDIRAIDSVEAMGIEDTGPGNEKWFVYSMTKKANLNNSAITQTLAVLRSRLELLAQELGECPCCLDSLVAERCTTLGCCHKVCTECWEHWVALKGSNAFCPLCKHQEFVEEVVSASFE